MVVKYVLVIFISLIAAGEAEFAKPPILMPLHAALSDDEILGITGYAKGIIRNLIESYLFDPDGIQTSHAKRNVDMNIVKEQLKHLNCIFHPCLYGGLCQLLDIDGKFVEDEFGVELGVFEHELRHDALAKEPTTTNFVKQQVAILRSLEDYFYRLEISSNKAGFIKDRAENTIQCICRPGSHPEGQCKGCANVELIENEFRPL